MAKLLLVDDDPQVRLALSKFITKAGHQLATAEDGVQAIEYLKSNHVDLILLDIVMPEQDGIGVIREIFSHGAKPKVIVITGGSPALSTDFIMSVASRFPIEEVLLKPVSYEKLMFSINRALAMP